MQSKKGVETEVCSSSSAYPFLDSLCRVCKSLSTGVHYGVSTCEGCKGFFKRSIPKCQHYKCYFGGDCDITKETRNRCKSCRFQRCLQVGMALEAVKMGRIPKGERERAMRAAQMGQPERRTKPALKAIAPAPFLTPTPQSLQLAAGNGSMVLGSTKSSQRGSETSLSPIPEHITVKQETPLNTPSKTSREHVFTFSSNNSSCSSEETLPVAKFKRTTSVGSRPEDFSDSPELSRVYQSEKFLEEATYSPTIPSSSASFVNHHHTQFTVGNQLRTSLQSALHSNEEVLTSWAVPFTAPRATAVASHMANVRSLPNMGHQEVQYEFDRINTSWSAPSFGRSGQWIAPPVAGSQLLQSTRAPQASRDRIESVSSVDSYGGSYMSHHPPVSSSVLSLTYEPSYESGFDSRCSSVASVVPAQRSMQPLSLSTQVIKQEPVDLWFSQQAGADAAFPSACGGADEEDVRRSSKLEEIITKLDQAGNEVYRAETTRKVEFMVRMWTEGRHPAVAGSESSTATLSQVRQAIKSKIGKVADECMKFAQRIPGITTIPPADVRILLDSSAFEMWMLQNGAFLVNGESYVPLEMQDGSTIQYTRAWMSQFLPPVMIDALMAFADELNSLQLCFLELSLLKAMVVVSPDRPGLGDVASVQSLRTTLCNSLFLSLKRRTSVTNFELLYEKVLQLLPMLAHINKMNSRFNAPINMNEESVYNWLGATQPIPVRCTTG